MTSKAEHVRQAGDPGGHTCHWPGCGRAVKPAMWGCSTHWFTLPVSLRARAWKCYRPGQENDKRPSAEYLAAAREIEAWALAYEARRKAERQQKELW